MNVTNFKFFMSPSSKPTAAQISWLASIFGPEVWRELSIKSDFMSALDTSIEKARRIALHHLAAKERGIRSV